MKRYLLILLLLLGIVRTAPAADTHAEVRTVYVVFKTHLDVGFTDLSSVVTQRYLTEFIPNAISVADALRAEHSADRYVWTTGSWLIWKYLHTASDADVARLEAAIRRGDIVWNAMPYTVESETMNRDLLRACLKISQRLDQRYGRHTISAKMTDVPGHTRSIVEPLSQAGISLLHIGVNPASPIPNVPPVCRWRDAASGSEVILMYQQDYGSESILPDGKTAVSVQFTGDNHGPHSLQQVKDIYADLRRRYPNARVQAATLNDVAQALQPMRQELPVVTSEIGDTWIYGYGGAPQRMARFRALQNLYSKWIAQGRLNPDSDATLNFALELGLIAEHTQGMDVKTHLQNWDKYDTDAFQAARNTEPFQKMEASWKEIDDYLFSAIALLPAELQTEGRAALQPPTPVREPQGREPETPQTWSVPLIDAGGVSLQLAGLTYQQFNSHDYDCYLNHYLRARYGWALADIGKPGLDQSHAVSVTLPAQTVRMEKRRGGQRIYELAFTQPDSVDARTFPKKMRASVRTDRRGRRAEVTLTIFDKPAVRLPEAYWLSFTAADISTLLAEKVGEPVDLSDVVERGNRYMHGIDRYVDIITRTADTLRIWSPDAFLINVGEARGLNYTATGQPDIRGGVHFNLNNNLWGTNFCMWDEGTTTYRFYIERIPARKKD